jgi:hypothetical protein
MDGRITIIFTGILGNTLCSAEANMAAHLRKCFDKAGTYAEVVLRIKFY